MFNLTTTYHYAPELAEQFSEIHFNSHHNHHAISNLDKNCDMYAPEIDWYLSHSQDAPQVQLDKIYKMFQNRLAIYDNAPFKILEQEVGLKLLIIGYEGANSQELIDKSQALGFLPMLVHPSDIISVSGKIGEFEAVCRSETIRFDQAVLFVQNPTLEKFLGIVSVQDFYNVEEMLSLLLDRRGTYRYKTTILYNPNSCQYHHRRPDKNGEGYCHKCVDVCPSFGVDKNDNLMELVFSQIDCKGCGGCVATCPTGAIDFAPYTIDCLMQGLKYYRNTAVLLIPEEFLPLLQDYEIPSHLTPLIIPREKFPSELHLLSITQESGYGCIFFSPVVSRPSQEAIELVNAIYQNIFKQDAIWVANDVEALRKIEHLPQPIVQYSYAPSPNEHKRKHFAERLRFMVKDGDFGRVESGKSGKMIRYGTISVDAQKCTLCLSCVESCNVDCLTANHSKFSLQYKPYLCTTCGYCVETCPEDAIKLDLDGIALNPSWFEMQVVAQDEVFHCIECQKPIGSKRAIEKIKDKMAGFFASDSAKLRTLECCSDCKVKIMFKHHFEDEA
ncbi:hypothetical protein BBW65_03230 [Helicobacter enhydrae]|uniref:4Fe-4S ferredoxin-type domain-containing protein n=1 Tax=Helicobacter enhydrae TaxID=222136 RepID=A0A1B1U5B1_9HELI|nr:4Fe-4S binding protein [Helicobacter enhydrae]ANV97875.1 hypothetical protein BBW65_03230 [Helicobacter enhydrae]